MFTSLYNSSVNDTFKDSIFNGLSIDGGLYYPKEIKILNEIIQNIKRFSNQEIGFLIMKSFINNEIPDKALKKIIDQTINFDFPIKNIQKIYFHMNFFMGLL